MRPTMIAPLNFFWTPWLSFLFLVTSSVWAQSTNDQLARDIHKELIEINTVTATGDTLKAAEGDGGQIKGRWVFGFRRASLIAGAT